MTNFLDNEGNILLEQHNLVVWGLKLLARYVEDNLSFRLSTLVGNDIQPFIIDFKHFVFKKWIGELLLTYL